MRDIADWQAAAPDAAITGFQAARWPEMGEGVNEPRFGMALVQPNFFDTIGVRPLVGRLIASDFDHDDVVRPVVITYELWQRRFHGDSNVIGQTYIGDPTSGRGFRVAGVMPRGSVFPSAVAVSFIAPYVPSPDVLSDPTRRTIWRDDRQTAARDVDRRAPRTCRGRHGRDGCGVSHETEAGGIIGSRVAHGGPVRSRGRAAARERTRQH